VRPVIRIAGRKFDVESWAINTCCGPWPKLEVSSHAEFVLRATDKRLRNLQAMSDDVPFSLRQDRRLWIRGVARLDSAKRLGGGDRIHVQLTVDKAYRITRRAA
jgi:hypothetical protein